MSDFELVKQRADIVDLVGSYVALQRAGRYLKACCPFHNEKTPSFYVYPDRQTWHCYGACATGGDVFTFIEKKEHLTPVEALKLLAERYGVELRARGYGDAEPKSTRLIEANEAAAQYFHNLLLNASAGRPARAYLEQRGLDAETVRAFQLGASSDGWETLKEQLIGRGFAEEELVAAGLLVETEKGTRDRFRGRVMFPIRDERGRVIGFGGRVLGDGVPKYLNSPQTALFDKSAILYALDRAKDTIRAGGTVVVVEGYMDAIAAHQHGITNVVATLGTALTERHVTLLKRYARQVVLAMDADTAGIEAALRGEELVRRTAVTDGEAAAQVSVNWRGLVALQAAAPLEVRVFTVPQGKDPDEAIRADPAAFQELARRAVPPFEFRLRHEFARIDRNSPHERLALADRLLPLVASVADRTVQAQYLSRLAQISAVPEDMLKERLRLSGGPKSAPLRLRERVQPEHGRASKLSPPSESADPEPQPARAAGPLAGTKAELACLRLLLTYAELREPGLDLEDDLFTDPANRALFLAWRAAPPGMLAERLDEETAAHHTRVLAERMPPYDAAQAARALADMVQRLRLRRLEDRARLLAAAVREAESEAGTSETASAALALVTGGEGVPAGTASEGAARLVQGVELARDRHALEVALRTGGAAHISGDTLSVPAVPRTSSASPS
jgi:DNA primase